MNKQLIDFIRNDKTTRENIIGENKHIVERVLDEGGYFRYVRHEQANRVTTTLTHDTRISKKEYWKNKLTQGASKFMTIYGVYATVMTCRQNISSIDCGLGVGGLGWGVLTAPIEHYIEKKIPNLVKVVSKTTEKVLPKTLGLTAKTGIIKIATTSVKTITRVGAGTLGGVFDIVDIARQSSTLADCNERKDTQDPCSDQEIKDSIVSLSFSSVSLVAGIAFALLGMTGFGIIFSLFLMVAQAAYSGWSTANEYSKHHETTAGQDWINFFGALIFIYPEDDDQVQPEPILGRPVLARFLRNTKDAGYARVSRVIRSAEADIDNDTVICLPRSIRGQDYESYCKMAIVFAKNQRIDIGDSVIFNAANAKGSGLTGSNEVNNIFLIFKGDAILVDGNHTTNRFMLYDPSFQGRIFGGSNATNILTASQSKNIDIFRMRFTRKKSKVIATLDTSHVLVHDTIDMSNDFRSYYYAGRARMRDHVTCSTEFDTMPAKCPTVCRETEILIDSGGGVSNAQRDVIEFCNNSIISPFTEVTGTMGAYTIYVETNGYNGTDLRSTINIEGGTVAIYFPKAELISQSCKMIYSTDQNALSVNMKFGENNENQFSLEIRNYVRQNGSESPIFAMFDKYGSNIIPRIADPAKTAAVKSFELYAGCATNCSSDDFDSVNEYFEQLLNTIEGYKVISVIKDEKNNNTFLFGSQHDDVIYMDPTAVFARGRDYSS